MEINEVTTLIGTLGFPIVMCLGMAWYVKYITDKNREQIAKLNEQHQTELKEITTSVNNNTMAISKLTDKLDIWFQSSDAPEESE